MLSPTEYAERSEQLERNREARRGDEAAAIGVFPTSDEVGGMAIEVAPGRGDLRTSSSNFPIVLSDLRMLGNRVLSYARLFQTQPVIAGCVMWMITRGVRVPLKTYRRGADPEDPNSKVRLNPSDHPVAAMIAKPWERGSTAALVAHMLGGVYVHGNSVSRVLEGRSGRLELRTKDWRFARPIMEFRDALDGFTFDIDSPTYQESVAIDEVLHIAWWSPMGPIGTSPLQQLGVTLQVEDATQRFQRASFENGMREATAIMMSDEFLGVEPVKRDRIVAQLRQDLMALYTGPENAGRPVLLPPGLTPQAIGQTTVEAALVDQRKLSREEMCIVYLIPPPLLGILDRATYSNIQVQREMTYTDCLGPPLILIEQTINAQIIRDLLQIDDVFVEFDFGEVLRGDRLAEIEALRAAVGMALMSPNEARGVLNMPRVINPGMDEYFLPLVNNLAPVGNPAMVSQAPIPPTPNSAERKVLHVRSHEADYEQELV